MIEAFINITGKKNHIRTRVTSATVSSHQRQRLMGESEIPTSERYRVLRQTSTSCFLNSDCVRNLSGRRCISNKRHAH